MGLFSKSIFDETDKWLRGFRQVNGYLVKSRDALSEWNTSFESFMETETPVQELLTQSQAESLTKFVDLASKASRNFDEWRGTFPVDETKAKSPAFALLISYYKLEQNAQALVLGARLGMVEVLRNSIDRSSPHITRSLALIEHGWVTISNCQGCFDTYFDFLFNTPQRISSGWVMAAETKQMSLDLNKLSSRLVNGNLDTLRWLARK